MKYKRNNGLVRNRKGTELIVDFWAMVIFAFIVLIFFILFTVQKHHIDQKMESQFVGKDVNYVLDAFLRAPAIGLDSKKTVADIITEDFATGDFRRTNILFNDYFNKYYSNNAKAKVFMYVQNGYVDAPSLVGICANFGAYQDYTMTQGCPLIMNPGSDTMFQRSATYIPDMAQGKIIYVQISIKYIS